MLTGVGMLEFELTEGVRSCLGPGVGMLGFELTEGVRSCRGPEIGWTGEDSGGGTFPMSKVEGTKSRSVTRCSCECGASGAGTSG